MGHEHGLLVKEFLLPGFFAQKHSSMIFADIKHISKKHMCVGSADCPTTPNAAAYLGPDDQSGRPLVQLRHVQRGKERLNFPQRKES